MACSLDYTPRYANKKLAGLKLATAKGDGYTIELTYERAYAFPPDFTMAYNIYFSTEERDVFTEGVKYIVTDPTHVIAVINGFRPGDVIYFAVRATEWPAEDVRLSGLPADQGFRTYPEAVLTSDISDTDLLIPIEDADQFSAIGVVQIGAELIRYTALDIPGGNLVLSGINDRGYYSTTARLHTTDGYDGVRYYDNPLVRHFIGFEEENVDVMLVHNRFQYPHYPRTDADGYKEKVDVVQGTSNLATLDDDNSDLPSWDYSGWRRDHPQDIYSGKCVGSYIGGEFYCADGYDGAGRQLRGIPYSDHNNMRLEIALETYGDPCVLLRRMTEGKVSSHYYNTIENTAHRGLDNSGTELVHGYEQFDNDKRSDRKILVYFGPTKEDIKRDEPGLENDFVPSCWTLAYPIVKDGDVIIRFNIDGTEEWRYEIINVERNRLIREGTDTTPATTSGAQKFTAVRIRKTDPINQVKVYSDIATIPSRLATDVGFVAGPGGIPPHVHEVIVSELTVTPGQINQFTSIAEGHNHEVLGGAVQEVLGHQHSIILP